MLIIFDLNKTLIHKSPSLMLRPYSLELFTFLKNNKIKIGLWSFCNKLNFKRILSFLEEQGINGFDFLKCDSIDSTQMDLNNFMHKKDLIFVSKETKITIHKIILIEDDERKCVLNQRRMIVKPFLRDSFDSEFKRIMDILSKTI